MGPKKVATKIDQPSNEYQIHSYLRWKWPENQALTCPYLRHILTKCRRSLSPTLASTRQQKRKRKEHRGWEGRRGEARQGSSSWCSVGGGDEVLARRKVPCSRSRSRSRSNQATMGWEEGKPSHHPMDITSARARRYGHGSKVFLSYHLNTDSS